MTTPFPEVSLIADQYQRAWDGEAWHGQPLEPLLGSIDATTAARLPEGGANSIHALTSHVTFWLDAARRRLEGEAYLPERGDWDIPEGENWDATRRRLATTMRELISAIQRAPATRLQEPVLGKDYNIYVLLHGALQHTLYHGGQIALLRRLLNGAT